MHKTLFFSLVCFFSLCLGSCIKPAPQNPEADIETFSIDKSLLNADVFIDQANRKILLYLKADAFRNGVVPMLTVSKGATVFPASGDSLHFNKQITYTVTSENGVNKKSYEVVVASAGAWSFDFENWQTNVSNKYEYPVEADGSTFWTTGNPGIALAGVSKDPLAYPTRSTSVAYHGSKAAELVTLAGTPLSQIAGVRLFAGSLFTGNFDASNAFAKPLEASQFGQPYFNKPLRFTGYYKYAPGANYQDENGNIIAGYQDSCAIYAVLFKGTKRLNATNINNAPNIIARADLKDGSARSGWTRFDIPFTYQTGADLSGPLMLTIISSSSKNGGFYRGAIGSKLLVDSLTIIN